MASYTPSLYQSIELAQAEAFKRKNTELSVYHLLWAMIKNPQSSVKAALKKHLKIIEGELSKLPTSTSLNAGSKINPSQELSHWLTLASSEVIQKGREEISESDLLKHLPSILPSFQFNPKDLKMASQGEDGEEQETPNFLLDLNERARDGKLDPVIGRTSEIRSVMEILGRRSKNNPVLVGAAGVGKTAIVEGLANKITKGEVPEVLKDKTIFSLDMGALMAGTKYRGEFEERLQKMLKFIKGKQGEAILFIDELHILMGAGKTDGAMDAANLLKPALARGELHCIGATTDDEYQKHILGDQALARRFREVSVKAPTREDAIEILMGLKEKFEMHHGIKISDEAIYGAVVLSEQYIHHRNLPDKAIDLIDEASSALKLSAEAMPSDLVELESQIRSKMIWAQVEKSQREKDKILKEVKELKGSFEEQKAMWQKEVLSLKRVSEIRNKLENLKLDLEKVERDQNYERASQLKYSLIPEAQKELEACSHNWILQRKNIAEAIARSTHIPVEKILQSKQDHILGLKDFLKRQVFGQDIPLTEISDTLTTSFAGLTAENRPLGSFMLLGPTGVGKTETVKACARYLFENEKNIIRLDMSEFSEKHSVAKLIGAPAGYVGYDEGGVLTEAVRRSPFSVILFDEIEKAHFDFSDILLQILDDGRLTDNKGRTIDFSNTIIFATSNSKDIARDFKPEVLGRFDERIQFSPIGKEIVDKLSQKLFRRLEKRIQDKNIKFEVKQSVYEALYQRGFNPDFGARPLENAFNRLVVRPLSQKILGEQIKESTISLDWQKDQLVIS